jgi:transketolase
MRKFFIDILCEKVKKYKKTFFIVGDLGFNVVEPFQKKFPQNFLNAGISEQNMAGIAAGISSQGYKVFIYSIANFPTFRCAEQIRNDIDYHNLDVTIVTVGSGVSYGNQGYTHHALQDYALMRSFPNTKIISPGDNHELSKVMDYIFQNKGPKYLRLEKDTVSENISSISKKINDGQWRLLKKGSVNKAIVSTGSCIQRSFEIIKNKNFKNYHVFSVPIWSMKSKKIQKRYFKKFKELLVVENHFEDGGFSSWLREAEGDNLNIKIKSISLSSQVTGKVGNKNFLEKRFFKKLSKIY